MQIDHVLRLRPLKTVKIPETLRKCGESFFLNVGDLLHRAVAGDLLHRAVAGDLLHKAVAGDLLHRAVVGSPT